MPSLFLPLVEPSVALTEALARASTADRSDGTLPVEFEVAFARENKDDRISAGVQAAAMARFIAAAPTIDYAGRRWRVARVLRRDGIFYACMRQDVVQPS